VGDAAAIGIRGANENDGRTGHRQQRKWPAKIPTATPPRLRCDASPRARRSSPSARGVASVGELSAEPTARSFTLWRALDHASAGGLPVPLTALVPGRERPLSVAEKGTDPPHPKATKSLFSQYDPYYEIDRRVEVTGHADRAFS
jgi:hypothetical protein